ncbi:sugar isomerase domain-containing protein [Brassicibacter mesophilus]|uniref:sugar isomerase domain-containing protein n=1 Tax=Brassicibacter mesophilus TaxID=745119 RepID=UPI003D23B76D
MSKYGVEYFKHIQNMLEDILDTQYDKIEQAAKSIADAIENGHTVFAFGCSHGGIIAEELFYRTGGLALINPIFNPTLMLNTRPVTMTSRMERLENFGVEIVDQSPIKEGDIIIIHSVSGRNPVVIDVALRAKEKGAYVIGITNMTYSKNVTSRHKSRKRLYEVSHLVLDNCGDFEDASIKLDGFEQKIAPTSTITGAAIVNAIIVEVSSTLLLKGIKPPIFHSANVDGGDDFNKEIFQKYRDRIFYL